MNTSTPVQKTISKEYLKQLIFNKNVSVTFSKQNEKDHTSKVWLHFSTIFVHSIKQDYVMCNSCMSLIAYKHTTGTGGMQKHIDACSKNSSIDELSGNKITSYFNSTKNKSNYVPRQLTQDRIYDYFSIRDCP